MVEHWASQGFDRRYRLQFLALNSGLILLDNGWHCENRVVDVVWTSSEIIALARSTPITLSQMVEELTLGLVLLPQRIVSQRLGILLLGARSHAVARQIIEHREVRAPGVGTVMLVFVLKRSPSWVNFALPHL